MVDRIEESHRSWNMSRIKSRDTKPELLLRKLLHRLGYRFRLHRKGLPGSPDIVLPKHRTVIFVHGCFWHRHPGCKYAYTPKSRVEFWSNKFKENQVRDRKNELKLQELDWKVLVVWECELTDLKEIESRMKYTIGNHGKD